MKILWWHWLLAGLCLIGFELLIPSFTIIWFGIGAIAVAVLSLIIPGIHVWLQAAIWLAASLSFTFMWFAYLKPKAERRRASKAMDAVIGAVGEVTRGTSNDYAKGIVSLKSPYLGLVEWTCYADTALSEGDAVRVTDVEGQILKVERIHG